MSKTTAATVKVMLSHNYCHFEVSKQIEGDEISQQDIDNARKECQRLADKAVAQYKVAKEQELRRSNNRFERDQLQQEVAVIRTKQQEFWSPLEKAKVKAWEDYNYDPRYNYMDDDNYEI